MPATKTTPEQRAQALALYQEAGLAEASRQSGVAKSTLRDWAAEAGIDTARLSAHAGAKTKAAVEMNTASMAVRRAALAQRMLAEAETEMERLRAPVTERRVSASGKLVEWTDVEPSPADRRAIATVAAILIDKSNLLAGEATSRTENLNPEDARRRLTDEFPGLLRVVGGGKQ